MGSDAVQQARELRVAAAAGGGGERRLPGMSTRQYVTQSPLVQNRLGSPLASCRAHRFIPPLYAKDLHFLSASHANLQACTDGSDTACKDAPSSQATMREPADAKI